MAVPECLSCGACCFSTLITYVRVSGDDHARLGDATEALVDFDGNRAFMRMIDGHCIALVIDGPRGQLSCSTYATRPDACRELERGGAACEGELLTKKERPLLALGRARAVATR